MDAAASRVKAKSGTWQTLVALADGSAGHFRIYEDDGTTCHMQGTVTITGNGGDLTLNSISISVGQIVTVTGFTLTEPNA